MGCACKNRVKNIEKFSDDNTQYDEKPNFVMRILQSIVQMIFGIVVGAIIIVATIPLLIYIIGCIMLGKQPVIIINKIKNLFSKKK